MPTDDFQIGSAVIPIRVEDSQVEPGLRKVEDKVRQSGSRAASDGDGGGLMSKYMFGRRGSEGVGDSMEHALGRAAFGRAARVFSAGGILGVGLGMLAHQLVEVGGEWLSVATGATAAAAATEKAAEANKKAAESMNELVKATQSRATAESHPKSAEAESVFERAVHPPGAVGAAKEALSLNRKKIDEQREIEKKANMAAMDAELTEDEKHVASEAGTRRRKAEIDSGKRGYYSLDEMADATQEDLAHARDAKKDRIRRQAIGDAGSADQMQARNSMLGRYESGMILGGRAGSSLLGNILPGLGQMGAGAAGAIDSFSGGRVSRGAAAAGEIGGQFMEGGRIQSQAAQHISDMRKDFARRKIAYETEKQLAGPRGATDVSNIGREIQSALLEPNPFEREGRDLTRKIHDINADMLTAIKELNPFIKLAADIARMKAAFSK